MGLFEFCLGFPLVLQVDVRLGRLNLGGLLLFFFRRLGQALRLGQFIRGQLLVDGLLLDLLVRQGPIRLLGAALFCRMVNRELASFAWDLASAV